MGHILTLTRNNDRSVSNKDNVINNAKIKINSIHWYLPHYTPSIAQQAVIFKQIQSKSPTELQYPERPIFLEEVNTQSLWNFELETQEGVNAPIWIFVGFQQKEKQNSQNLDNDFFVDLL